MSLVFIPKMASEISFSTLRGVFHFIRCLIALPNPDNISFISMKSNTT